MAITNENQFQKWVVKSLLPGLFKIHDIIQVRDKVTHGVPDLIAMTQEGIMAIELKFKKTELVRGKGLFGQHKLTKMQHRFLCNWAKASRGFAFVLIGVEKTKEIMLCDYHTFKLWDTRDVRVNDADNAVMVPDILECDKEDVRKRDLRKFIQMLINPIWIGHGSNGWAEEE